MGDCDFSCAKYGVFIFNFFIALTGLAILVVGGLTQHAFNNYANFVGDTWYSVSILMMVIGGVIFFVSFLGCCGAIQESPCMIRSFAVCLLAIILFEVGVGVAGFVKRKELGDVVNRGLNQTLTHYQDNEFAWKFVQTEFKCCGITGPDDWRPVFQNSTLPRECCRELPAPNSMCDRNDTSVIVNGCKTRLFEFLDNKAILFGIVGLVVALLQLIGLGYACYLHGAFRRNYEWV